MIAAEADFNPIAIEIGGIAISLKTADPQFRQMLANRYENFVRKIHAARFALEIDLFEPRDTTQADSDVTVERQGQDWLIRRGDFRAEWNNAAGWGKVSQSANPYAIDSVLRIVHTLILADRGGFLVHAASAVLDGRAFLFAGRSGAGKTTISRLAPLDVTLLSDEISYVGRTENSYAAFGTPFAGELARVGENVSAPLQTLFILEKGQSNRIEKIGERDAVRALLSNILFFAKDEVLVSQVFHAACEFIDRVPVRRLIFVPDRSAWEIIRTIEDQ